MNAEQVFVAISNGGADPYPILTPEGAPMLPGQLQNVDSIEVNGIVQSAGSYTIENSAIEFILSQTIVDAQNRELFASRNRPPQGAIITWTGTYLSIEELYDNASDYVDLITQQHAFRPKFRSLVASVTSDFASISSYYRSLLTTFDLDSATGTQLDVVGMWIGLTRRVKVPIDNVFFEWDDEETPTATGWDYGVWQGRFEAGTSVQLLPDDIYRRALRAKVEANKWDGSKEGLYRIFDAGFSSENLSFKITDNQDMSFDVEVSGQISNIDRALLTSSYLPIRPGGVSIGSFTFTE